MRHASLLVVAAAVLSASALPLVAQDGTSAASASRSRALAAQGLLPLPDEIRVEHFLNWHRHGVPLPRAGEGVALEVRLGAAELGERGVVQVGLATERVVELAHLPPVDLALVIDCSGSMAALGKLERVREALTRFVDRLRPEDRIALIAFSDEARVISPLTARGDGRAMREALAGLRPEGSTNLHAGLVLGLGELERGAAERRVARVLVLTDGLANVGVTDPEEIVRDAKEHQGRGGRGIDVSTIGFGTEIDRVLLSRLAEGGHGLAHFIGDDGDVAKVFEREAQALLAPVARDVELELSWPAELDLERIYGYAPVQHDNLVRIGLDDLNAGATAVVLAAFERAIPGPATIAARLSYFDVARGERRTLLADATFQQAREAGSEPVADHEVRKNLTIAALASALRAMAEEHAAGNDGAATATLRDALAVTERHYPRLEDEDVRRVHDVGRRYLDVLCPASVATSSDAWGPLR